MALLPFERLWPGSWTPCRARALQAPRMHRPRARGEGHSLQPSRTMGTLAGKDGETQVGAACARGPLLPPLVAGTSGKSVLKVTVRTLPWGHTLMGWGVWTGRPS